MWKTISQWQTRRPNSGNPRLQKASKETWLRVKRELFPKFVVILGLSLVAAPAAVQTVRVKESRSSTEADVKHLRIPNRAAKPLFEGKQGKQGTEIHFDPATRTVTVKLLVQDPNGYFIPNLRRDNFVVYENGVRQQNATLDIEHAPASLFVLLEFGGPAAAFNRILGPEVSRAGQQLLDVLRNEDKVSIWKYSDNVQKLADGSQSRTYLDVVFDQLGTPELSEANLYDALIYATRQMQPVEGRKAVVVISSGLDTSSKANYDDVLKALDGSGTPVYAIGLSKILRDKSETWDLKEPLARINWTRAERELQEIARKSGGRAYFPDTTIELSPVYDDLMENLKVRYVITYRSSNDVDLNRPRTIRVQPNTWPRSLTCRSTASRWS